MPPQLWPQRGGRQRGWKGQRGGVGLWLGGCCSRCLLSAAAGRQRRSGRPWRGSCRSGLGAAACATLLPSSWLALLHLGERAVQGSQAAVGGRRRCRMRSDQGVRAATKKLQVREPWARLVQSVPLPCRGGDGAAAAAAAAAALMAAAGVADRPAHQRISSVLAPHQASRGALQARLSGPCGPGAAFDPRARVRDCVSAISDYSDTDQRPKAPRRALWRPQRPRCPWTRARCRCSPSGARVGVRMPRSRLPDRARLSRHCRRRRLPPAACRLPADRPTPSTGAAERRDAARRALLDALDAVRGRKALVMEAGFAAPLGLLADALTLREHGVEVWVSRGGSLWVEPGTRQGWGTGHPLCLLAADRGWAAPGWGLPSRPGGRAAGSRRFAAAPATLPAPPQLLPAGAAALCGGCPAGQGRAPGARQPLLCRCSSPLRSPLCLRGGPLRARGAAAAAAAAAAPRAAARQPSIRRCGLQASQPTRAPHPHNLHTTPPLSLAAAPQPGRWFTSRTAAWTRCRQWPSTSRCARGGSACGAWARRLQQAAHCCGCAAASALMPMGQPCCQQPCRNAAPSPPPPQPQRRRAHLPPL